MAKMHWRIRPSRVIRYGTAFIILTILLLIASTRIQIRIEKRTNDNTIDKNQLKEQNEVVNIFLQNKLADETSEKIDYHDYSAMKADENRKGPGEHGMGVRLDTKEQINSQRIFRLNGFSGLVSDKISLYRSLKDIRHPDCQKKRYQKRLPSVSLIVPFHQEHWSTLLRTFISALIRSPKGMIKEVILVDDYSTKPFLNKQLEDFVIKYFSNIVRIIRTKKREGLIRTRIIGARVATADVLVFLDSHCECNINWLPPLLEPIALNYKTVTCPFIDIINYDTFAYSAQDEGARGVFNWEFLYKRLPRLPEDDQHPAEPFESPVMAGGLFAISSKWFWELGGYDPGLEIWGGEQYELSFKVWQCGGRMIDIPCSRIGHVYRKFSAFLTPKTVGDYMGRNFKRIAEVWMDEYKEYLYSRKPNYYKNIDTEDITAQKQIRERLSCRPFKWFMEHVAFDLEKRYPAVEPGRMAEGQLRHMSSKLCANIKPTEHTVDLSGCIKQGHGDGRSGLQDFEFTWHQDIRPRGLEECLDFASHDSSNGPVVLFPCHVMGGNQAWRYNADTQQLVHPASKKCLVGRVDKREVSMDSCFSSRNEQKWIFERMNMTFIRANYHF